jgi:hypothetical protein
MGKPVGDQAEASPDQGVRRDRTIGVIQERPRARADENPRPASTDPIRNACILDRLEGDFEEDTLLRVHGAGFDRQDAEGGTIKSLDSLEEPALTTIEDRRG